jgi:hypothetical protein
MTDEIDDDDILTIHHVRHSSHQPKSSTPDANSSSRSSPSSPPLPSAPSPKQKKTLFHDHDAPNDRLATFPGGNGIALDALAEPPSRDGARAIS